MSKVIELLIKMGDPKCVSVEAISRGESVLHKEQIIAAFAQAENTYPFGYHMLLVKYRRDEQSRRFASLYVAEWCNEIVGDNHATQALDYVVDMVADIPLPAQQKRLRALKNRYLRSQFAYTKDIEQANKTAQVCGLSSNSKEARQLRIAALNGLRKSTICPRCCGTGEIGRVQKRPCPECDGKGRLTADVGHLIKSLGCTEEYFKTHLNALVTQFEQHCYIEMSNAENLIKNRLKNETMD